MDDVPCMVLYARLTVENLTRESAAFPVVSAQLTTLTDVPGEVPAGDKAACDYAVIIHVKDNDLSASARDKEAFGSFDDNITVMKAFWDKQLSGSFTFTEMPEEAESYAIALQTEYIDLLCGISTDDAYSLAAPLQKLPADTSALSCFDAALYYMKTENSDFLDSIWENLQKQYTQLCDDLEIYIFTAAEQEEKVQLLPGSSPETALEENLNALIELKAFAFLLTKTCFPLLKLSCATPFPTAPPIGLSQICPAVLVKASFLCLQTAALLLRQTGTKEIPYSMLPAAGPI